MKLYVRMKYLDEQGEMQAREQESAVAPNLKDWIRIDDRDRQVWGHVICYERRGTGQWWGDVEATAMATVIEVQLR
jgi:hypothetical protein